MGTASRGPQDRQTLLIVDDQPNNIKVLFDFLVQNGYRVLVAQDGESALEKAENAQPGLILLDVMMPGIDGFETCRRLKLQATTKDIPVVFMTALSDTPYSVKGFEVGGADYVTKPIQQEEILVRVKTQLAMRRMYLELEATTRTLQEKNAELEREVKRREQVEAELREANELLYRMANIDGLTHVANRRCFDEVLDREWRRAARAGTSLSMILCDIDHFKLYNDAYGHLAGDQCLKQVAKRISTAAKRFSDRVARYGGEEFATLLPSTDPEGALEVAEQIQAEIRDLAMPHAGYDADALLTLSLGVATMRPTKEMVPERLVDAADRALYTAKNNGRNCIVVAG